MNNKNIGIFGLFLLLVALFWCTFFRPVFHKQEQSFKIGVIAPLSGDYAALGESVKNGFEMAMIDSAKDTGVPQIEMYYEDACLPGGAVSAVHKLLEVDKIDLLGGSFCVIGFVPVLPIMESAGKIAFSTANNPDVVLGSKYLVSTQGSIKDKAAEIADFAYEQGARTAATIFYNTPLGVDYDKHETVTFGQKGGKILAHEMHDLSMNDFRTILLKVKSEKPDVLFVTELAGSLGILLKQARELGITATIIGNDENEDPIVLNTAGSAAEGFIIPSDEVAIRTEAIIDFEKRYEQMFGRIPDVFAANAYDAFHLQSAAFRSCKSAESSCLLAYLHSVKNYTGVSGTISIGSDGTALKPSVFKVVKDGKFFPIGKK